MEQMGGQQSSNNNMEQTGQKKDTAAATTKAAIAASPLPSSSSTSVTPSMPAPSEGPFKRMVHTDPSSIAWGVEKVLRDNFNQSPGVEESTLPFLVGVAETQVLRAWRRSVQQANSGDDDMEDEGTDSPEWQKAVMVHVQSGPERDAFQRKLLHADPPQQLICRDFKGSKCYRLSPLDEIDSKSADAPMELYSAANRSSTGVSKTTTFNSSSGTGSSGSVSLAPYVSKQHTPSSSASAHAPAAARTNSSMVIDSGGGGRNHSIHSKYPPVLSSSSSSLSVNVTPAAVGSKKRPHSPSHNNKTFAAVESIPISSSPSPSPMPSPSPSPSPSASPVPAAGASSSPFPTSFQHPRYQGWSVEGYYARWSEVMGTDIWLATLGLAVGSWFANELLAPPFKKYSGMAVTSSMDPTVSGYTRLVEGRLYWSLCSEDALRLALAPDDLDARWQMALRKARSKLVQGDTASRRILHSFEPPAANRHVRGVCMQATRVAPPPSVNSKASGGGGGTGSNKMMTHWRFVPFAGEHRCMCGTISLSAAAASAAPVSLSLSAPPASAASLFATSVESLHALFLAALKSAAGFGVFVPLATLAANILAGEDKAIWRRFLGNEANVRALRGTYELKHPDKAAAAIAAAAAAAGTPSLPPSPFFTDPQGTKKAGAGASPSAESKERGLMVFLLEYLLLDPGVHTFLLSQTPSLRAELAYSSPLVAVASAAGVSMLSPAAASAPPSPPELQVAWIPAAELSARAKIKYVNTEADRFDPPPAKVAPAASTTLSSSAPMLAPPKPARSSSAGVGKSSSSSSSSTKKDASAAPSASTKKVPKAIPLKRSSSSSLGPNNRIISNSNDNHSSRPSSPASLASSSAGGGGGGGGGGRATPAPLAPAAPALPAVGSYLAPQVRKSQAELAAEYKPEVHTEIVASDSPLARQVTHPVHPALLLREMQELFLSPGARESATSFRDRFLIEAFVPYVMERWWTAEQLVDDVMKGRYGPVLACAFEDASSAGGATMKQEADGVGASPAELHVRWMLASVSQLFGNNASEYMRAQLRDNMWRVYRRPRLVQSSAAAAAASSSSSVTPFEFKFVKLPVEHHDRYYPPRASATAAATATTEEDEQARKRARLSSPPRDEHKSAVNLSSHTQQFAKREPSSPEEDGRMRDVAKTSGSGSGSSSSTESTLRDRIARLERDLAAARASSVPLCVRCRHRGASVVLLRCGHTPWCETCTLAVFHKNSKRVLGMLRPGGFLSLQPHEVLQCPLEFCKTNNSSIIRPLQRAP